MATGGAQGRYGARKRAGKGFSTRNALRRVKCQEN
jgi:hypothetical protein